MKACVLHAAHDLRIEEQDDPQLLPGEVRISTKVGGICGSDLHYFHHGRVGDFVVREPLVPGHEFAGEIAEVGADVVGLKVGDRVAVNPARTCGQCKRCQEGRGNLCERVFFMGSASKFPHMQGGFRERVVVEARQCHVISAPIDYTEIAFAEPLAVCLHAATRAPSLLDRRVLITGAGPIGLILLLVARHAGAAHVAITDLLDQPLAKARAVGADAALKPDQAEESGYDVVFEASGAPVALNGAITATRPGGTIVQVGSLPPGPQGITANRIMAKELTLAGSFRFHTVFADAVACLERRALDVRPLLTGIHPIADASHAFSIAGDRTQSVKVMIGF